MYDSVGTLKVNLTTEKWNNFYNTWYNFELSFNNSIGLFLIDGEVFSFFQTSFTRGQSNNYLIFSAEEINNYRLDEVIIYKEILHTSSFDLPEFPLSFYPTDNPYADIYFGTGFLEDEVSDIKINASLNTSYCVKLGTNWYYFFSGAWRISDGTFSQSSSLEDFEVEFANLVFDENKEIIIRAFLESDGIVNSWIDEIEIVLIQAKKPASITGSVEIETCVDLSSDYNVVISTDQGSKEIDLSLFASQSPASTNFGSNDLSSGYDWDTTNESFTLIDNTGSNIVAINISTTNMTEVLSALNAALPSNYEAITDINETSSYVSINSTINTVNFELIDSGNLLTTLGISEDTYLWIKNTDCVTIDEIVTAINNASVPGLNTVSYNDKYQLILKSTTTGADAFVSIDAGNIDSALSIVWGLEDSDTGEEASTETVSGIDYSETFRWVRSMLGAPIVPVELTDEQINDCLGNAVYQFNKWRNFEEDLIYVDLEGDFKTGYKIPSQIGNPDNIIELIFHPDYTFSFYGGKSEDLMTNIYIQQLFQNYGHNGFNFGGNMTDWYLTLSFAKDVEIIMGTTIKWDIHNERLFIFPEPEHMTVGIRYRSPLTPQEINNSVSLKNLVLAEAKILLGNIRLTFGGTIPGGSENIQLNGSELVAQGQQEKEKIIEGFKVSTALPMLEIF